VITQATFHRFLVQYPDAAVAVVRSVGGKLRWATQRRIDFSGLEVRLRLARVLVELASAYGLETAGGVEIAVALAQPELAALVGAAEPTVHKALADFRRRRIIVTGYRCIRVVDLPALRVIAGHGKP
jgi:CRP-like cAMP-binding protein